MSSPKIPNNVGDREYRMQLKQQKQMQAEKAAATAETERRVQAGATGRASTMLAGLNTTEPDAPKARRMLLGE